MQADLSQRLLDGRHLQGSDEHDDNECDTKSYIREADIPPISLLYEGFCQFLDIFRDHKDVPGMEKIPLLQLRSAVDAFAEKMSVIYPSEDDWVSVGLTALGNIFSARTEKDGPPTFMAASGGRKIRSDGHVIEEHGAIYCVTEFKNDSGGVCAIPYVEMASYFAHSIGRVPSSSESVVLGWRVPCLGITIIGPCIKFYALICLGHHYRIVSLTPELSCIPASGDGDDRQSLYATFTAASILLARIRADAKSLATKPPRPIEGRRISPPISKLHNPNLDGTPVEFKILDSHSSGHSDRHLYLGKTTDGNPIVVKFTHHYSPELHMFCAARGHAPTLLGFQRLPGGFFAVAMEWASSAVPLSRSTHAHKHEEWKEQLQTLVKAFHAADLVHGDLRSLNILCDEKRVMLIDFDWGGKLGETSYPDVELNPQLTEGRDGMNLKFTKDDDLRVLHKTLDSIGSE